MYFIYKAPYIDLQVNQGALQKSKIMNYELNEEKIKMVLEWSPAKTSGFVPVYFTTLLLL